MVRLDGGVMDSKQTIQSMYDAFAKGDVPYVLGMLSPNIVWNEAENFVYADRNPYIGPQAVLEGVFMRLRRNGTGFRSRSRRSSNRAKR
jgi:ketosteroid isomerase-like protein